MHLLQNPKKIMYWPCHLRSTLRFQVSSDHVVVGMIYSHVNACYTNNINTVQNCLYFFVAMFLRHKGRLIPGLSLKVIIGNSNRKVCSMFSTCVIVTRVEPVLCRRRDAKRFIDPSFCPSVSIFRTNLLYLYFLCPPFVRYRI